MREWLIKWNGRATEDTTWEDETLLKRQFPSLSLKDKAPISVGSNDRPYRPDADELVEKRPKPVIWNVYSRRNKTG